MEDGAEHLGRVLILGGGTAGWLAALHLNRVLRRLGCEVALVESPAIGPIGVGEATVPTLVHFIRTLGLDEAELMRRTAATYKLGIRFEGWGGDDHAYFHPFGGHGALAGLDLFHFWARNHLERPDGSSYADHALQALLARAGKGPAEATRQSGAYAFHLDAAALGAYLREIATAEGVKHHFGLLGEVALTQDGDIRSIGIGGERTLSADLFVDASGFASALIEGRLGDPWIDWSSQLLCDRAVAMPLPVGPTLDPFTRSIAARAGWCWRIPLTSRTGTGYVYSSAHTSDERAVEDLIALSDLPRRRTADPRMLTMRVGRRTRFWTRNCVSIGFASGFVEPLESTGIHLTQKAVQLLLDNLPRRRIRPPLRDAFNAAMGRSFDEVRDFVLLHYLTSRRREPFWYDTREVAVPDSLAELLDLYDISGGLGRASSELFADSSFYAILAGCGRLPEFAAASVAAVNRVGVAQALREHRGRLEALAAGAPGHDAMMANLHRVAL